MVSIRGSVAIVGRWAVTLLLCLGLALAGLAPALASASRSTDGHACCKRNSAGHCCKRSKASGPRLTPAPVCGQQGCECDQAPAPSMLQRTVALASNGQALPPFSRALAYQGPSSSADSSGYLAELFQRPPPSVSSAPRQL